jgi:hypothetical protein
VTLEEGSGMKDEEKALTLQFEFYEKKKRNLKNVRRLIR